MLIKQVREFKTVRLYLEDVKELEALADRIEAKTGMRLNLTQLLHHIIITHRSN